MSARPPLSVYLYGRHVADLLDTGAGEAAVRYTPEAVADPPGCRLSLSLPVQTATHITFGPGGRWVRSLLPEGRALAWAVQAFGIPEDDRYGLIAVLGADVAGAVQILEPGRLPDTGGRYDPLSAATVNEMVGRAHTFGLGLDRTRGVRLSLAGMQDKVLLHQVDGAYQAPVGGAPSTLIVKPEPQSRDDGQPTVEGIATNELFCGVLAGLCGLDASDARVEMFGDRRALVVTRYDRTRPTDGVVGRLHQEDLLSAMGLDPLLKYERPMMQRVVPAGGFADAAAILSRNGPTLSDMAGVLARHMGLANLGAFLKAVAFNMVIGNADAHARNYSVLLSDRGEVRLAPLYDLTCTRYWDHLDSEAAQRVADNIEIDDITTTDLVAEAVSWGIPDRVASQMVGEVVAAIETKLEDAASRCVELGGEPAVAARLVTLIAARVRTARSR